ncbi:hypothetical protein BDZ91DRAFT_826578 [Kalaharituber pfeilii]|nr:hypothetical protein BDZ91DRAFT_826578 [Kalaharituber pfeilii]
MPLITVSTWFLCCFLPSLIIQYLTFVLVFFVLPAHGDADSAIDKSSDVWAALIANIAPLLILVGEKHVKAYFKVMSRCSHYALYAAGPIGLITAITTLIRLNGAKMLKRLIGRQFETRAEVLADVTSVVGGEVCLELKNGNLEQTTNPDPEHLALFYVHGKQPGTGNKVLGHSASCEKVLYDFHLDLIRQDLGTYFWCTIVASFRAEHAKGDAVGNTRFAANIFLSNRSRKDTWDQNAVHCEGSMATYAAWTGVSLNLTASHCLDNWLTDVERLVVASLCTLGNIGAIVSNWLQQKNVQNTFLVSVGLIISAAGSFITAWLVDEATEEKVVDLSVLQVTEAGFYSPRTKYGNPLSFCPKAVIMSTFARTLLGREHLYVKVLTNGLVVLMTLGYVALYLGLRTSKWWASLAMLSCSAVASVARAWFAPDRLELREKITNTATPFPFSDTLTHQYDRWDLFFNSDTVGPWPASSPASSPTRSQASTPPHATSHSGSIHTTTHSQPKSATSGPTGLAIGLTPVIVGPYYETIASTYISSEIVPASQCKDPFLATILDICLQMRKQNLLPVELTRNDSKSTASPKVFNIYSDLLGSAGVWRQPLEIIVSVAEPLNNSNPLDELMIPLKSWFWRAMAVRKRQWAKKLSDIDLQLKVNRNASEPMFADPTQDGSVDFDQTGCTCAWMGAKIAYVVFARWTTSKLEQYLAAELDAMRWELMDDVHVQALVNCMKTAGLAVSRKNV